MKTGCEILVYSRYAATLGRRNVENNGEFCQLDFPGLLLSIYTQLSTRKTGDVQVKWKTMSFLEGRRGCNARQGCGAAQEKIGTAGRCFYPGSTCLGEKEREIGNTRGS